MIDWNETEFIEFLNVLPENGEDFDIYRAFTAKQEKLKLSLRIDVNLGDVSIVISHEEFKAPLVNLMIFQCQLAKVVRSENVEYIEFSPGRIFGPGFDQNYVIEYGIRLFREPNWRLELFGN